VKLIFLHEGANFAWRKRRKLTKNTFVLPNNGKIYALLSQFVQALYIKTNKNTSFVLLKKAEQKI